MDKTNALCQICGKIEEERICPCGWLQDNWCSHKQVVLRRTALDLILDKTSKVTTPAVCLICDKEFDKKEELC